MRNDYPNHPAGPLRHEPDPNSVLLVHTSIADVWVLRGCAVAMVFLAISLMMMPVKFPSWAIFGSFMSGVGMWLWGDSRANNPPLLFRVRPDGIEFPSYGYPALAWSDIAEIDMGTVRIPRAGPQDVLGIKLRPERRPQAASPFMITGFLRAAMTAAGWDFDICLRNVNFGLTVPHLVMEMRARHEAARQGPPQVPEGLKPLPVFDPTQATVAASGKRSPSSMAISAFLIFFGCGLITSPLMDQSIAEALEKSGGKASDNSMAGLPAEGRVGLGAFMLLGAYMLLFPGGEDDE